MIFTIIFSIIGGLLGVLSYLLPAFTLYPESFKEGCKYAGSALMKFNFIFAISDFMAAVVFLIQFEIAYFTVHIILSIIHTIRGNKTIDI